MADLIPMAEDATWVPEIHQRPAGEPLTGGAPDLANDQGFANVPTQQLAKRTGWLKEKVDALVGYFTAGKLKETVLPSVAARTDTANTFTAAGALRAFTQTLVPADMLAVFGRSETQFMSMTGDASANYLHSVSANPGSKNFAVRVTPDLGATSILYTFNSTVPDISIGANSAWHKGNCPNSLNIAGYQRLKDGIILQWGQGNGANGSVTFPIAFPVACRSVVAADAGAGASTIAVESFTNTGANIEAPSGDYTFYYIAIGY